MVPSNHEHIKHLVKTLCDTVINKAASGMMNTQMINTAMNLKRDAGKYFEIVENNLGTDATKVPRIEEPTNSEPSSQEQAGGLLGMGESERLSSPRTPGEGDL